MRTAALLLILLCGCNGAAPVKAAPAPVIVPAPWALSPPSDGAVEVNNLMTCIYADGVLTGCALNSGATLDDFANSVMWSVRLTEGR